MDRYVKNFISISIFYLAFASILGIFMLVKPELMPVLKFSHSHLMLLGWVTMMIYGVGYHILPRFAGKLIKKPGLAELQFWLANIGLIGMVVLHPMLTADSTGIKTLLGIAGALEVISSGIFFYNMTTTLYGSKETPAPAPQ